MLSLKRCFLKQGLLSKCEIGTINLFNPTGMLGSNHQFHSVKTVCSCTDTQWGPSLILGVDSLVSIGLSLVGIGLNLAKVLAENVQGVAFQHGSCYSSDSASKEG